MGIYGGYLNMDEFNTTLSMERVSSNIEGILGGGGAGDFYNQLIEALIPDMLEMNRLEISEFLRDTVMEPVNKILNEMKLSDLIGLLKDHRYSKAELCTTTK